jgi:hypothetical protein
MDDAHRRRIAARGGAVLDSPAVRTQWHAGCAQRPVPSPHHGTAGVCDARARYDIILTLLIAIEAGGCPRDPPARVPSPRAAGPDRQRAAPSAGHLGHSVASLSAGLRRGSWDPSPRFGFVGQTCQALREKPLRPLVDMVAGTAYGACNVRDGDLAASRSSIRPRLARRAEMVLECCHCSNVCRSSAVSWIVSTLCLPLAIRPLPRQRCLRRRCPHTAGRSRAVFRLPIPCLLGGRF